MATYFISFNPHVHRNTLCILLQQDLHLIMQLNIGSTLMSAEQSHIGWTLHGDISWDNNDHFHIINLSVLCHSLMWILDPDLRKPLPCFLVWLVEYVLLFSLSLREKMPFHHVTAGLLYKGNYLSRSLSEHSNSEQLANISVEELDGEQCTYRHKHKFYALFKVKLFTTFCECDLKFQLVIQSWVTLYNNFHQRNSSLKN